nr:type VI secretion system-associated FHA domain protein TagH [Aminobacter sp. HY435]
MLINLTIENVDRLPNGGPITFSSNARGFAIGRDKRDWNLPDPDLFISGLHCEVRFDRGAFWLHDVSRNGTFLNGSDQRMSSPYRLADGDRLCIGRYIVAVSLEGGEPARRAPDAWGFEQAPPQRSDPFFGVAAEQVAPRARPQESRSIDQEQAMRPAPPAVGKQADAAELLRLIAAGAGVSPDVFQQRDPREVAAEIGSILRLMVDELSQMLKARAAAKALARTSQRTMIGGVDNNPLKFVPRADEILDIMFARHRAGYLDARQSVEEAFRDLKAHEIATYAAMQAALSRLLSELSPDAIEAKSPGGSFVSRKGRAWDTFVATWDAREAAHENGMLDVFLAYFSEAYAKSSNKK